MFFHRIITKKCSTKKLILPAGNYMRLLCVSAVYMKKPVRNMIS